MFKVYSRFGVRLGEARVGSRWFRLGLAWLWRGFRVGLRWVRAGVGLLGIWGFACWLACLLACWLARRLENKQNPYIL